MTRNAFACPRPPFAHHLPLSLPPLYVHVQWNDLIWFEWAAVCVKTKSIQRRMICGSGCNIWEHWRTNPPFGSDRYCKDIICVFLTGLVLEDVTLKIVTLWGRGGAGRVGEEGYCLIAEVPVIEALSDLQHKLGNKKRILHLFYVSYSTL